MFLAPRSSWNLILVQPNDVVSCEVALTDHNGGITSRRSSVSIENASPTIDDSVTDLSQRGVFTDTELLCTGSFLDIDEDNRALSIYGR